MRDMVPRNERSIRNIPVPAHSRRKEPPPAPAPRVKERIIEEEEIEPTPMPTIERTERRIPPALRPRPSRGRRWFLISAIAVIAVCVIGGLLLATLFAGATVTVYPRQATVTAPKTITAKLNPGAGELGYQTMTVSRSATTTVAASGSKAVSRSASGVVAIYNTANTETQRLVARTRFEAPDGKIYRIQDSVVVPGATKAADGTFTPGTVTATIYADSPGPTYNITGDTRFTVPGFKGDPKFNTFYAQGNAITGGFIGNEPAIATADLSRATDTLKQGLSQAAQSALASQVPSGFVAVPGTLQITFSDIAQTAAEGNNATISQSATMTGAIVRSSDLASVIAKETVESYGGQAVAFADMSQLSIAAATSTKAGENIPLILQGSPTLVWQYDPNALKSALVGKPKNTFEDIIKSFEPAITRAEAKVRPFWEGNFPSNPDKIEVIAGTQ